MIVLINAKKGEEITKFQCFSRRFDANITSNAEIRAAEPGPYCLWTAYIINCTTVEDPDFFGLRLVQDSKVIGVKFEYPVREKYPVIMCYPPMVYESRWQQIIFATEIYRYFGTDLQIQYINSAMIEIVEILKRYALKKWVSIEKFAYFDLNHEEIETIGYQPLLEIAARNQPLAYTKCLTKYRESAEFVIIADVDDVLIPKFANYYQEFQHWKNIFPHAAAFLYYRSTANIFSLSTNVLLGHLEGNQLDIEKTQIVLSAPVFANFSITDIIKSFIPATDKYVGKSVYQTKNAEVPWIHWPFYGNETTAVIPHTKNKMFHMGTRSLPVDRYNLIPEKSVRIIASEFKTTFQNVSSFTTNSVYADAIFKCYGRIGKWHSTAKFNAKRPCLTPLYCPKPKYVKGFKCQVANRKLIARGLSKTMILHVPNSNYFWTHSKNGCSLYRN